MSQDLSVQTGSTPSLKAGGGLGLSLLDAKKGGLTPLFSTPSQNIEMAGNYVDERLLKASRDSMQAVAEYVSQFAASSKRSFDFRVDEYVGGVVVQVFNSSTGELVRQIPSEEFLRIARHIENLRSFLLDIRA